MQNNRNEQICIRQCSEPEENVQAIYKAMNYKQIPFSKRKFVVPPA